MRGDELVAVYRGPPGPLVEIVAGALRARGIAAVVFPGEFEQSAHMGLGRARVMVRAADAAQARRIIEESEEPTDG